MTYYQYLLLAQPLLICSSKKRCKITILHQEYVMKSKSIILTIIIALSAALACGQELTPNHPVSINENNQNSNRHFIGSSLFLLGNLDTGDPVYFGQLNYGYQLSPKSNLIVEAITWT